jgi:hypothetical protein
MKGSDDRRLNLLPMILLLILAAFLDCERKEFDPASTVRTAHAILTPDQ